MKPSSLPVVGFRLAMYVSAVLPLMSEVSAGEDVAVVARDRLDLAVRAVGEAGDHGARGGVDLGDVGRRVPPTAVNLPPM